QEVAARQGKIILITDPQGAHDVHMDSLSKLTLPAVPATVTPLVYAIPVQLIAYHTAVVMGTDVDQPRNLAKSVTVECSGARLLRISPWCGRQIISWGGLDVEKIVAA